MTLSETALAFARECLGWRDAKVLSHEPDAETPRLVVISALRQGRHPVRRDRPSGRGGHGRRWCTANGLQHAVRPAAGGQPATATVTRPKAGGDGTRLSSVSDPDPCRALLAACVEAHRRLRG